MSLKAGGRKLCMVSATGHPLSMVSRLLLPCDSLCGNQHGQHSHQEHQECRKQKVCHLISTQTPEGVSDMSGPEEKMGSKGLKDRWMVQAICRGPLQLWTLIAAFTGFCFTSLVVLGFSQ